MKKFVKKQTSKNTVVKQLININKLQLNLIKKTQIFFIKHFMFIKGPRGIIVYSFFQNSLKYNITFEKNFLIICRNWINVENKLKLLKADNLRLFHLIQNLINGVHFFFFEKTSVSRYWVTSLD